MSAPSSTPGPTAGQPVKPAIVLVHGAWAGSSSWALVIRRLRASGYRVHAIADPLQGLVSDTAHLSSYLATIKGPVADRIAGQSDAALREVAGGAGAPRVTFTEPQVAAAGLTGQAARDRSIDVQIVSAGTSATAGGTFWGAKAQGTSQLVIDRRRRIVVGATFTGSEVQDMLQAATFAVAGELTLEQSRHGIAPFPARSEAWLNLPDATGLWRERQR